jgi:hypothetical protein
MIASPCTGGPHISAVDIETSSSYPPVQMMRPSGNLASQPPQIKTCNRGGGQAAACTQSFSRSDPILHLTFFCSVGPHMATNKSLLPGWIVLYLSANGEVKLYDNSICETMSCLCRDRYRLRTLRRRIIFGASLPSQHSLNSRLDSGVVHPVSHHSTTTLT